MYARVAQKVVFQRRVEEPVLAYSVNNIVLCGSLHTHAGVGPTSSLKYVDSAQTVQYKGKKRSWVHECREFKKYLLCTKKNNLHA